jgi:hypothetical protein
MLKLLLLTACAWTAISFLFVWRCAAALSHSPHTAPEGLSVLHGRVRHRSAPCARARSHQETGRPLTGPLSSGVRIRRRVEASEDSRLSVRAHPVFRSVGCASVADAHQTPIWIKSGRIAPARERRHRPAAHSSPRKSSVPAAAQGESQSARARRESDVPVRW